VDTIAKRARRRQDSSQQRANELMDRLNSVAYTKALEVADEIRRSFHQSGVKLEAMFRKTSMERGIGGLGRL